MENNIVIITRKLHRRTIHEGSRNVMELKASTDGTCCLWRSGNTIVSRTWDICLLFFLLDRLSRKFNYDRYHTRGTMSKARNIACDL